MSGGAESGSLPAAYFEAVYAASDDPWSFQTSAYEAGKYADTVSALAGRHFESGFEIGCSIGVLTRSLALQCSHLLAIDINEGALASARRRCADLPQVEFRRMQLPAEFPEGRFDLVVMSEVGYYWSPADLDRAFDRIETALLPGGQLLLVHWTPEVPDYPQRGDDVHAAALSRATPGAAFKPLRGWRRERYRLDLLERAPGADAQRVGPAAT